MDRRSSDFQYILNAQINEALKQYDKDKSKYYYISPQQYLVSRYISGKITKSYVRGMLLYHDMGVGKTRAYIECVRQLKQKTLCIMAAALIQNFKSNVESYEKITRHKFETSFHFVSLDAYNMFSQLEKLLDASGLLSNWTIIVDEAHEFFSKITNSTNKNAPRLSDVIMKSQNIHLIFGSGTPFWKDPIEIVPCFNMLTGQQLFPNAYVDFYDLFISKSAQSALNDNNEEPISIVASTETNTIEPDKESNDVKSENINKIRILSTTINENVFQNRLYGLVSYIPRNDDLFPEKKPLTIVKVEQEFVHQWSAYKTARLSEKEETKRNAMFAAKKSSGLSKFSNSASSTYRQKSRSISNGIIRNNQIISPKGDAIVANIEKEPGKGIVYSQFKANGIYIVAELLKKAGWTQLFAPAIIAGDETNNTVAESSAEDMDAEVMVGDIDDELPIDQQPDAVNNEQSDDKSADNRSIEDPANKTDTSDMFGKVFAIYDGDTPADVRKSIIDKYNEPDNKFGKNLRIILVTTVGTRGISLQCGLHAHMLEPYWFDSLVQQFETRISRLNSHVKMPPNFRYTKLFVYLTTKPAIEDPKKWYEYETTDEYIYNKAIARQYILDQFLELIREVAIECPHMNKFVKTNRQIDCRTCVPNKARLYTDNIFDELNQPSPCLKYVETNIEAHTILVDGIKYAYKPNDESIYGISIYQYNDKLDAYTILPESNPLFNKINDLIDNLNASK